MHFFWHFLKKGRSEKFWKTTFKSSRTFSFFFDICATTFCFAVRERDLLWPTKKGDVGNWCCRCLDEFSAKVGGWCCERNVFLVVHSWASIFKRYPKKSFSWAWMEFPSFFLETLQQDSMMSVNYVYSIQQNHPIFWEHVRSVRIPLRQGSCRFQEKLCAKRFVFASSKHPRKLTWNPNNDVIEDEFPLQKGWFPGSIQKFFGVNPSKYTGTYWNSSAYSNWQCIPKRPRDNFWNDSCFDSRLGKKQGSLKHQFWGNQTSSKMVEIMHEVWVGWENISWSLKISWKKKPSNKTDQPLDSTPKQQIDVEVLHQPPTKPLTEHWMPGIFRIITKLQCIV